MSEGPKRTAAIAWWLQSLYVESAIPVLVGGSAVELYTGGAYTTGDLDFVGHVPASIRQALVQDGFEKHGKNWIHQEAKVFLEFPSSSLGEGLRNAVLDVGRFSVQIASPEDLLVDRLAGWKHWKSPVDGVNSFLLYRAQCEYLDEEHLKKCVLDEDVKEALASVRFLHEKSQGKLSIGEVLENWSRKIK